MLLYNGKTPKSQGISALSGLCLPNRSRLVHGRGMGSKRLDNIADYRRHGFDLQVRCANCGHTKRHAAETILALCNQRGWSKQMMMLEPKFRCSQCGSRSVRCGPLERDDRAL